MTEPYTRSYVTWVLDPDAPVGASAFMVIRRTTVDEYLEGPFTRHAAAIKRVEEIKAAEVAEETQR